MFSASHKSSSDSDSKSVANVQRKAGKKQDEEKIQRARSLSRNDATSTLQRIIQRRGYHKRSGNGLSIQPKL